MAYIIVTMLAFFIFVAAILAAAVSCLLEDD